MHKYNVTEKRIISNNLNREGIIGKKEASCLFKHISSQINICCLTGHLLLATEFYKERSLHLSGKIEQ